MKERLIFYCLQINRLCAQQFKTVIIDRQAEGIGLQLRQTMRQQTRQTQMHIAPGKGVDVKMMAFFARETLNQKALRRG